MHGSSQATFSKYYLGYHMVLKLPIKFELFTKKNYFSVEDMNDKLTWN